MVPSWHHHGANASQHVPQNDVSLMPVSTAWPAPAAMDMETVRDTTVWSRRGLSLSDMTNDGNEAAQLRVLPRNVFARRADRLAAAPSGPSFERAWAALDPPGNVLDIGAGAGAASLPLLPRCTGLIAVDSEPDMLDLLAQRAATAGATARLITGTWPAVAAEAGKADVVTCHHVAYNVAEIEPFLAALTAAARRVVVLEMTEMHPLASLNSLWLRFHGLVRPSGPSADDLLAILAGMGVGA